MEKRFCVQKSTQTPIISPLCIEFFFRHCQNYVFHGEIILSFSHGEDDVEKFLTMATKFRQYQTSAWYFPFFFISQDSYFAQNPRKSQEIPGNPGIFRDP